MKRSVSFLLVIVMLFAFASCGGQEGEVTGEAKPGDVPVTYADSMALEKDYGFTPKIGIREGLGRFAKWYAEYTT